MSKKTFWIIIAIGISVGAFYWMQNNQTQSLSPSEALEATNDPASGTHAPDINAKDTEGASDENIAAENVSVEFRSWVAAEALLVEQSVGAQEKEAELKARASSFSTAEIQYLKYQSLSLKNTAHERILSTYLLTLTPATSLQALADIAAAPLQRQGEFPVHSPEETLSFQEKALRRMAIDTVVKQAALDDKSQQVFKDTVSKMSDPNLKEYMERLARGGK